MNVESARRWIVLASLTATGSTFLFFMVAPLLGYPLTWHQGSRLFELIIPVFIGYLGAATQFLVRHRPKAPSAVSLTDSEELLKILIKGPLILFGVVAGVLICAFGYSNRISANPGEGMSIDVLAWAFAANLSMLAVTTNVIVPHLFSIGQKKP